MSHEVAKRQSYTTYIDAYGKASRSCEAYGLHIHSTHSVYHKRVQEELGTAEG